MFDRLGRPVWQAYFMYLATTVAQRSLDPSTKCGCVIVDDSNNILVTGYNSPPRGVNDKLVPLNRPVDDSSEAWSKSKYPWMIHSEEAAIATAAANGIALRGSTIYVTGTPCTNCLRKIINAGIKRIIYGNVEAKMVDDEMRKVNERMISESGITVVKCSLWEELFELHKQIEKYISKYSDVPLEV